MGRARQRISQAPHAYGRRRRRRYAIFRAGYVAYRTAGDMEATGHLLVGIAIALGVATALVLFAPRFGVSLWITLTPMWAAGVYAVGVAAARYRRVWAAFPRLRREMRRARMAALRDGGVVTARNRRRSFLRVRLPFYAVIAAGVAVVATVFPRRASTRGMTWQEFIALLVVMVLALWVEHVLQRRHEREPPVDVTGLCARCGYDVSASPTRCPECGLRRMTVTGAGPTYRPVEWEDEW